MIYISYIRCFERRCVSYDCDKVATIGHLICNTGDNDKGRYFNMYCTCDKHKEFGRKGNEQVMSSIFVLKMLQKCKDSGFKYGTGNNFLISKIVDIKDFIFKQDIEGKNAKSNKEL